MGSIAKPAGTTVQIEDSLTSASTTAALSANKGKELNETKQKNIISGTAAPSGGSDGDIYIQY